jgi:hypothetical protein
MVKIALRMDNVNSHAENVLLCKVLAFYIICVLLAAIAFKTENEFISIRMRIYIRCSGNVIHL